MKRISWLVLPAVALPWLILLRFAPGNAQVAAKSGPSENGGKSLAVTQPSLTAAATIGRPALFKSDFNTTSSPAWPDATAFSAPQGVTATVATGSLGTVDVVNTTEPSGALLLTARVTGDGSVAPWNAALVSGLVPVASRETNLGKLTLSFSLSASRAKPVTVKVESFDAAKKRTGGLVGVVYPAAPDFFQRYALDLSTLKADGMGKFQPAAPFVQFSFGIAGADWPAGENQLRVDNVNYSGPTYYVSPKGSDQNDGRSEKTALATPQKAIDLAQAGDIILLMNGTFQGGPAPVVSFKRAGTPDAWISLKNYPGHKPILTSTGWNIVSIAAGSKEKPDTDTTLAYLEMRGLHVRGEGDVAKKKYPDAMNKSDSRTNTNGIAADGRYMKNPIHHLRFADNLVEYCPAQGLGSLEADWVTIENNTSRFNCWTTIYATSGISVMGASNFDATDNVYKHLIRNNVCYRNQTYEIWEKTKRPSDGNGIILDVNQRTTVRPNDTFRGRSLVQSNLCFDNGGSGIHAVQANRVDIIGNTAYLNSVNPALQYSQIYTYGSEDVRIMNNILVAPVADVARGEKPEPVNRLGGKNKDVVFSHNIYYGGNVAPTLGEGDVIADPRFVKATRDGKSADFHLRGDSPAVGKGMPMPFGPYLDLDGKLRRNPPAKGAYER